MDGVLQQMKKLTSQYGADKLILFGSRARGDHHERSDYDFAVFGMEVQVQSRFLSDIEDNIDTLLKIDVIFIDAETNLALIANIQKDGIVIMNRYQIKLDNFRNAIERLQEAIVESTENFSKVVRDGVIQRYEFTCELAWKTTREYLLDQGYSDINSPKAVMKQAFSDGLIDDQDGWVSLLTDRNLTSHLYDDATAQSIYQKIVELYLPLFVALRDELAD